MSPILVTTLVLGLLGLVCGAALAIVAKRFAVPENPLVAEILAALPGANCGGCGHPGCDGYARAVAEEGAPLNLCTSCNAEMLAELERITGRSGGTVAVRRVALVHCVGDLTSAGRRFEYNGLADCAAAQATAGGDKGCTYGCLGYGSCVRACPTGAIAVENGLARVNPDRCIGCGACARACPRQIISLVPVTHTTHVLCSSHDRGPAARKLCSRGCIGCGLCSRLDIDGTFSLQNFLATINYEKPPTGYSDLVASKCPAHCIITEKQS